MEELFISNENTGVNQSFKHGQSWNHKYTSADAPTFIHLFSIKVIYPYSPFSGLHVTREELLTSIKIYT